MRGGDPCYSRPRATPPRPSSLIHFAQRRARRFIMSSIRHDLEGLRPALTTGADADGWRRVLPRRDPDTTTARDGLPLPPQRLWRGYGTTEEEYLRLANLHSTALLKILEGAGFDLGQGGRRVLDFGCAAGPMLAASSSTPRTTSSGAQKSTLTASTGAAATCPSSASSPTTRRPTCPPRTATWT